MVNQDNYKGLKANFQAKGDGVTDDTLAIKRFLDYLATNGGTGLVEPGVYMLTSYLRKNKGGDKSFNIIGIGSDKPVFKSIGTVALFQWEKANSITVENISLDCQYTSFPMTEAKQRKHGMVFSSCNDVLVKNCSVVDFCGSGIIGYRASGDTEIYRNLKIQNCYAKATKALEDYNNAQSPSEKDRTTCIGMLISDYWDSEISDCTAEDMSFFGVELKNHSHWNRVTNCLVKNCQHGFGMGQQTPDDTGCEHNIFNSILVKSCQVGGIIGKGKNNLMTNINIDFSSMDATKVKNAFNFQLKARNNSLIGLHVSNMPSGKSVVAYLSGANNNRTEISGCYGETGDESSIIASHAVDSETTNNFTSLSLTNLKIKNISSTGNVHTNKVWYDWDNTPIVPK